MRDDIPPEPGTRSPARLHRRPTWLLSRAGLRAQQILGDAFAASGARGYHYRALAALEGLGAASQAELGAAARLDRSDVAATVEALAGQGLVVREPDPTDRRRNVVSLTDAGRDRFDELDAVVDRVQEEVLAGLTPAERATLVELLVRVADPAAAREAGASHDQGVA